jgi:hypothetical protein
MGEDRVRALLGRGDHFEPRAMPLVRGWLERQEQARAGHGAAMALPNLYREFERLRKAAGEAVEAAEQARASMAKTQRFAMTAVVVSSVSMLISLLALFALAID